MNLKNDAEEAAAQAAAKLVSSGVLDLMNIDVADPRNAPQIQYADLSPTKGSGR